MPLLPLFSANAAVSLPSLAPFLTANQAAAAGEGVQGAQEQLPAAQGTDQVRVGEACGGLFGGAKGHAKRGPQG